MENGPARFIKVVKESGVDLGSGRKNSLSSGRSRARRLSAGGGTITCGLFAVKDTVKPGAHAVVEQLLRQNLKTFLVTGDNTLTAAGIADRPASRRRTSPPKCDRNKRRSS